MAQEDSVPNELVGRWCYVNLDAGNTAISNSCFTLNQDGTFEAILDRSTLPNGTTFAGSDNDSGTWWVKGKLLHYNSTANGRGSFSLQKMNHPRQENTPMIVLNGIPFAADSPRNPW
ncbi:MAG TPA: hypothetical protein DGG95_12485 [Cytophagales bacterium]|nr:hypothetical protein [Cytophagales bacterium]